MTFQKFLIPQIKEEPDPTLSDNDENNECIDKDDQEHNEQDDPIDKNDIMEMLKFNCRRSGRNTVKIEKWELDFLLLFCFYFVLLPLYSVFGGQIGYLPGL